MKLFASPWRMKKPIQQSFLEQSILLAIVIDRPSGNVLFSKP